MSVASFPLSLTPARTSGFLAALVPTRWQPPQMLALHYPHEESPCIATTGKHRSAWPVKGSSARGACVFRTWMPPA